MITLPYNPPDPIKVFYSNEYPHAVRLYHYDAKNDFRCGMEIQYPIVLREYELAIEVIQRAITKHNHTVEDKTLNEIHSTTPHLSHNEATNG